MDPTFPARGELTPVTRHGINRVDSGPLQRCSFEETCEILMDAGRCASSCSSVMLLLWNVHSHAWAGRGRVIFDDLYGPGVAFLGSETGVRVCVCLATGAWK